MNTARLLKRIECNPAVMIGKPVIKGTRLTVELVVEKLATGESITQLLEDYPFLKEEDVRAALLYSARSLSREEVYAV
ncbi:MAG: DUF433 domain-containing protein [Geobacter sp.]|nr:DUF433 domain-containing protein [Geobacter sp.]